MTYAAIGLGADYYSRKQANPERYPSCATAAEKAAAKAACKPTSIRGLAGKIAGAMGLGLTGRFDGANPCWVETLPTCPTCLTLAQALTYASQIQAGKTLTDPIAALPYCSSVPVPTAPSCLKAGDYIGNPPGYDLIQYCKKAGGTDAKKNGACYLIMRAPAYWSKVSKLPKCGSPPKLTTRTTTTTTTTTRKPPTLTRTTAPTTTTTVKRPPTLTRTAPAPTPAPAPAPAPVLAPPQIAPTPLPSPPKAGISTGSIVLAAVAVGGGYWLYKRRKKG